MKVFITRQIPERGITMLKKAGYEVAVSGKDGVLTPAELKEGVKGADAVLCLLTDKIDEAVLQAAGDQLKIVANYAVGYNNLDVAAGKKRNVVMTNTPGVLTETVAEYALAAIMALTKNIVPADKFTRGGRYQGWAPLLFLGSDLGGKTLGVVGLGRIGSVLAQKAYAGLGMKIVYYDVQKNEELEKKTNAQFMELDDLLGAADVVSIHVPLLDSTHHLINAAKLALMKQSAYLVNTSRGPVVDEAALVEVLKNKKIAGAFLDVFEDEPALKPGLVELENVVLTPHIASATRETRSKMSEIAAQNIIAVLSGQEAPNRIN
ncbi:MAG: D-glycerate dehydrogenase [Candidatus Portnoybacteria bacterium CG10_big_fil_rev_8_21_14_0_10_44_7]|uniref:D-glycerate dehydrogenase n=1 Tax=Candidatus Portnoybacteria bacterium CG10_big_fil_rev_8_21_14_0_10_44_7 TaxID=1974816 RepID=A0A2M8KIB0_9BACT|nr:MAG: D-glycerate dehydrogenase [Candidatus Portnoybacteria bacterium CG10_big_fil_rev_8_21_14_0_10_44_7]